MQRQHRDRATRAVLDVANTTLVAVICFALLTVVSTQVHSVRRQPPWRVDPYDAVAPFAMLVVPIVGAITWMRKVR